MSKKVTCPRCLGSGAMIYDGARLRKMRVRSGLSLHEMARHLKLTASYLCDIELDRRYTTATISKEYEETCAATCRPRTRRTREQSRKTQCRVS